MLKFVFLLLVLSAFMSCQQANKPCSFGNPTAIFDKNMSFIKNHNYEIKQNKSAERLELPEFNLSLEIFQSGCDTVQQEFKLILNGSLQEIQTATQLAELIADIFAAISELDKEKLAQFMNMAQSVGNNSAQFAFGQALILSTAEQNLSFSINIIRQANQTIIGLTQILS